MCYLAQKRRSYGYNKKNLCVFKVYGIYGMYIFDAPSALHLPYLVVNNIHILVHRIQELPSLPLPNIRTHYTPELEFVHC